MPTPCPPCTMQHATCNMQHASNMTTCDSAVSGVRSMKVVGDKIVGRPAEHPPTTSPRICIGVGAWEVRGETCEVVLHVRHTQVRILANNPALPVHYRCPPPPPCTTHACNLSSGPGGGGSAAAWMRVGRLGREGRYHRRGRDRSAMSIQSELAVQGRAPHGCIKAPPEPLVFIVRPPSPGSSSSPILFPFPRLT
jgi:hypothetical protein